MEALAHDLRGQVPDLAGQFEESRPSQRRNSGYGLFTEMIVDRSRPAPAAGPTGDLGTVHAMVGALPDPIAFRVRVRHGVLLGLIGDSYGQDTRAIDFATVPFDQVFMLNDQGDSIPFEPAQQNPPSPLLALQKHDDPPQPSPPPPRLVNVGPLQKLQEVGREPEPAPAYTPALDALFGARTGKPSAPAALEEALGPLSPDDRTSLRIGAIAFLIALGLILYFAFDVSPFFLIFAGLFLGRFLQSERGLRLVRRIMQEYRRARTTSS